MRKIKVLRIFCYVIYFVCLIFIFLSINILRKNMRKIISIFIIIISILIICLNISVNKKEEYIRIHVRANSNEQVDQNIKYKIKDEIVSYLIPYIAKCETREDFVTQINISLDGMKNVADKILKETNFDYQSKVSFRRENFPDRSYDGTVLKAGIYDSIIVELGLGVGDNWWCVVYPPLCFISNKSQDVMYKSRILEILKSITKGD